MKKILSFIVLLAGVISFTSCSSDDASYKATPKLEVASAEVLFEAEGGNGSIVVNASDVTATTSASWLTLSVQGNKVVVNANPNLTLEGRSAVIKLVSGSTEAEVTATQKSSIYGIATDEYQIGDYQASLKIDVVHNQPVTVESQSDWITAVFNPETSQIEIVAQDNNDADPRLGSVKITMGQYSDEIAIVQDGLLLEVEKEVVKAKNEAGSVKVLVNHSRPVTVESNDDWIEATWDSKKGVLTCSMTANETGWRRLGTVTLTSGPVSKTVTISQFDFVKNIEGAYMFVYYSNGWKYVNVVLEATSETEGTLTWQGKYTNTSGAFVIPVTFDAETESFNLANWADVGQTYTKDGTEYKLNAMVMMTNGTNIYRVKSESLPYATATLSEDEDGVYFDFSAQYQTYDFYALRIGYGAGGYDGYAGALITYPYCYMVKM